MAQTREQELQIQIEEARRLQHEKSLQVMLLHSQHYFFFSIGQRKTQKMSRFYSKFLKTVS